MWRRVRRLSAREIAKRVWEDILKTPEIESPKTPESAVRHAPETGVYEGASPFVYWRVLSSSTLLVVVVVAALVWVLLSDLIGEHSASPTVLNGMTILVVTMGLIIIVGILRDTLPVARLVRWSPAEDTMSTGRRHRMSPVYMVLATLFGIAALAGFCLRHLPEKTTAPITRWLLGADDVVVVSEEVAPSALGPAVLSACLELASLLLLAAAFWRVCRSVARRRSLPTASGDRKALWLFCGWILAVALTIGLDSLLLRASVVYAVEGLLVESVLVIIATGSACLGWRRRGVASRDSVEQSRAS